MTAFVSYSDGECPALFVMSPASAYASSDLLCSSRSSIWIRTGVWGGGRLSCGFTAGAMCTRIHTYTHACRFSPLPALWIYDGKIVESPGGWWNPDSDAERLIQGEERGRERVSGILLASNDPPFVVIVSVLMNGLFILFDYISAPFLDRILSWWFQNTHKFSLKITQIHDSGKYYQKCFGINLKSLDSIITIKQFYKNYAKI